MSLFDKVQNWPIMHPLENMTGLLYSSKVRSEERSNYIPIPVLLVVSRLFEKIIYDKVFTYFTKNEFFCSNKSGIRQFHSVLTFLIKCTND